MHEYNAELTEFENKLRASGYQQLEPFYILKEGEIYDERDGGMQKITKSRLQKIADTQNERTINSGDATPIIIGHTRRQLPEKEQPPIVGLAPRWEVVKFYKTDKWALQAIPWAKPGSVKLDEETLSCVDAFDRFPRRSAEFWTNPDVLDPISLLGANTPRLDLGLHRLQQNRQSIQLGNYRTRTPILLEMDMPLDNQQAPDTLAPATPGNQADAAVFNSDRFKRVEDCCAKMEDMLGLLEPFLDELRQAQSPMDAGGPMGGMGGGNGAMGGQMGAIQGGNGVDGTVQPPPPVPGGHGSYDEDEDDDDDEPVRASASVPGGTNTMMPRQYDRGSVQQPQQPMRQSRRSTQTGDPRDTIIQDLRVQVAALQLQRIEDTVTVALDNMADKIEFNRDREFKRLVKLSKQEFDDEVSYMLATYKPKDEPLPTDGPVPLQMQRQQGNQVTAAGGPITLQQARDMLHTPADPNLQAGGNGAGQSTYDRLVEIVRNRGKNGNVMDAYHKIMGAAKGTGDTKPS